MIFVKGNYFNKIDILFNKIEKIMIDSHCHLDHEPLLSDLSNVIKRSKDVGIEKLLTISTSFESFSNIKKLIKRDKLYMALLEFILMKPPQIQLLQNRLLKILMKIQKLLVLVKQG